MRGGQQLMKQLPQIQLSQLQLHNHPTILLYVFTLQNNNKQQKCYNSYKNNNNYDGHSINKLQKSILENLTE